MCFTFKKSVSQQVASPEKLPFPSQALHIAVLLLLAEVLKRLMKAQYKGDERKFCDHAEKRFKALRNYVSDVAVPIDNPQTSPSAAFI